MFFLYLIKCIDQVVELEISLLSYLKTISLDNIHVDSNVASLGEHWHMSKHLYIRLKISMKMKDSISVIRSVHYKQKVLILCNLKELFCYFNPDVCIGFSSFCSLRPKHVLLKYNGFLHHTSSHRFPFSTRFITFQMVVSLNIRINAIPT